MPHYTLTTTRMEILYAGEHSTFMEALEQAISDNIRIIDMDLRHMDLRGATLDGGQFHNCLFDDSNLQGANLSECTFTLCDFRRTNLTDACLCYTDLIACRLEGSNITRADFAACYFLHCTLNVAGVLPSGESAFFKTAYALMDCIGTNSVDVHRISPIRKKFFPPLREITGLKKAFEGNHPHTKGL